MSISPIITFKAGRCDLNTSTDPPRVTPLLEAGYIYLHYSEDGLVHFCWRQRSASLDDPVLDLVMVPEDGSFTPYEPISSQNPSNPNKPTNGRIYVLKFASSSQRHLFWLQSRSQHQSNDPAWFSARDLKLGQIVNTLLQGEDVDVQQAIANLPNDPDGPDRDDDDDATMEDVEGQNHDSDHHRGGSGGAGPNATGGDIREEGQEAREGGADGGRAATTAPTDASAIIQNFFKSMKGRPTSQTDLQGSLVPTLADLLTPVFTIPLVDSTDESTVDRFLDFLPPALLTLAREAEDSAGINLEARSTDAESQGISLEQKKGVLRRVLRSPQFSQSLASLTIALRDGGLPSISEALKIPVQDGGFMRRGGMPLGGGDAVVAFLNGVKVHVEKSNCHARGHLDVD